MNRPEDFFPDNATTANPIKPASSFDRPSYQRTPHATAPPNVAAGSTRFDPVTFRQTSGIARPAKNDTEFAVEGGALDNAAHATGADHYRRPAGIGALVPAIARGRAQMTAWASLGLISAAYLGTLTWQRGGNLEIALAPVTESIERLAGDIADLRQTTAAIDARQRATADRVNVHESRLEGFAQTAASLTPAVPSPTSGQRPTNRAVLAETTAAPPPVVRMAGVELTPAPVSVTPPLRPARQVATVTVPGLTNTPGGRGVRSAAPIAPAAPTEPAFVTSSTSPTSAIATGSVPAATTLPAKPVGLLVASGPSLDSIKLSWTVLHQNHSAVLGALEPRILPAGDGSAFQLVAGPFATDAEAQKACAALRARGVGCKPADFVGAPL